MESSGVLMIIGLFVLRLGVPLAITIALGYGLSRLDARWKAEGGDAAPPSRLAGRPQHVFKSAAGFQALTLQQTFARDQAGRPCWDLKDCSEAVLEAIAACESGDVPCWEARRIAEGELPADCRNCEVYQATVSLWIARIAGVGRAEQEVWHS